MGDFIQAKILYNGFIIMMKNLSGYREILQD